VANTEAVARLEGQFGHLVAEFNRIEEEELQSHEMVRGQYMIDEIAPTIVIMSMSKPPPHLLVRKELITMRKKKKKWRSKLSPRRIHPMTRM
jgi:hypothetical protein